MNLKTQWKGYGLFINLQSHHHFFMRYMKWIGFAALILLVISCFTPWVFIASRNITVSGIDATGTNYGKPGYFHFVMAALFLVLHITPKIWAKRFNLLVTGLNTAWAFRNFFVIAACYGGECPERKAGLFLVLLSSVLMLLSSFFPDIKFENQRKEK